MCVRGVLFVDSEFRWLLFGEIDTIRMRYRLLTRILFDLIDLVFLVFIKPGRLPIITMHWFMV